MTAKQIFNTVKEALLKQGKKSKDEFGTASLYRGCNGRKCAIGHLIPDELYDQSMEMMPLRTLLSDFPGLESIVPTDMERLRGIEFLYDLQVIHDFYDPITWRRDLLNMWKSYEGKK